MYIGDMMKVITLKQPWATLIAEGYKKYEFRTWKTNYRGEIYIHAGKGIDKEGMKRVKDLNLVYPQSKIVAKVILNDCIALTSKLNEKIINENKMVYGSNKNRTGYAWKIEKVEKIDSDNIINGKLGLWNYDH